MYNTLLSLMSPTIKSAPPVKIRLNVGMMVDIPTGEYVCVNGRWILNGGLQQTTGVAGLPNTFKSTFMTTLVVRAVDRLLANSIITQITTYDTENTAEEPRLFSFVNKLKFILALGNPFEVGLWVLTNKNSLNGTDWWSAMREVVRLKVKEHGKLMVDTPYVDRNGNPFKSILPTFNILDSITAFSGKDAEEIDEKVDLGDSKGLTMFMKAGLAKARFLTALPRMAERANIYFLLSAHVGERGPDMSTGPSYMMPDKKIPTMKGNQVYKGVTDNFFSLLSGIWQTHRVKPALNNDKKPLYPKDSTDTAELDTDLQHVFIQLMRSKSSGDGIMLEYILSKTEGFLPELSEFHLLREKNYYGLEGSNINYYCSFYPEVKLQRTTIRKKLEEDPLLCRAVNICSEMWQIYAYRKHPKPSFKTEPPLLYQKLVELGYDWKKILSARGWHSLGIVPKGVLTITTMDLLAIYAGELDLPEFKFSDK